MEFLSVREFSAYPRKTRDVLKRSGKVILTNNGKPSMLVLDISQRDFEGLLDTLNRAEALYLLEKIQMQAVKTGLDSMSMNEIDAEVSAIRRKRK